MSVGGAISVLKKPSILKEILENTKNIDVFSNKITKKVTHDAQNVCH